MRNVGRTDLRSWWLPVGGMVALAAAAGYGQTTQPAVPVAVSRAVSADANAPALDAEHQAVARKLIDGGLKFILAKKDKDGGWSMGRGANRPALTAMVLTVLVRHGDYGPKHAVVNKGFEELLKSRQADGGIYDPGEGAASYTAAVALMALAAAEDPAYAQAIRDEVKYLKSLQIVPGGESADGGKIAEDNPNVGAVGYGPKAARGDLSVTGMFMQSLHDAGVDANDPAMQRAAAFITRMQNSSETNAMAWAKDGTNDGGFIYSLPGQGGRGPQPAQGPRTYGSMTYTGFKSLLYAGVDRKDPRVQAAFRWIQKYWQLDSNPNMPAAQSRAGLFYYYHAFAKALRAWGEPVIADAKGARHNWRHELIDALAKAVKDDGSWVNDADRWQEGDPVLTTTYSLLALQEALRDASAASKPARKGP